MKRVKENGLWTLMCPDECPGLSDVYGDEFEELYTKYEEDGRGRRSISAQTLWSRVLQSQIETGTPYLLYKDACNQKSNQKNLGTIKSSNLCCEIVEYSSPEEAAVCNLSSIGLPKFICKGEDGKKYFDFDKLGEIVKQITKNLNRVIDINYYPIPETRTSNFRHRPIGIGVQGLADVFAMLLIPFDSEEAKKLNRKIFEVIYYYAMECSMDISRKREKMIKKYKEIVSKINIGNINSDNSASGVNNSAIGVDNSANGVDNSANGVDNSANGVDNSANGVDNSANGVDNSANGVNMEELIMEKTKMENDLKPIREELDREKYLGSYSSFEGSPASKGIFQYDMWEVEPSEELKPKWDKLKKDVKKHGLRNSLLVAPMPTASTSQILNNNECFEPRTSNLYIRRTLAGEFIVINEHLVRNLIELDLWNEDLKNQIIKNEGSIQSIVGIPDNIKEVYKTVWEMSQKVLIDMAADRGAFICQSQSLNLFIAQPTFAKLSSMHFYSWKKGLKTGIYYLRTKPVAKAQQFTIEPEKKGESLEKPVLACSRDNPDCIACGS